MGKRILAAIDFSMFSTTVMNYAVEMAKELKGDLVFINVLDQRQIEMMDRTLESINFDGRRLSEEADIEELVEERELEMLTLIKQLKADHIPYKLEIYTGIPYRELLAAIHEHKAELVIMGTKGKTDLKDVLEGSTSTKLFRRCPVPILFVRETQRESTTR
jgi:nucleotide-binding universal stress UspA family protein